MNISWRSLGACLAVMLYVPCCWAQKDSFTRALRQVTRQVEQSSRPQSVKNAAASLLQMEKTLGGSCARDMFSASFKSLPERLPQEFTQHNAQLQQKALHNFLEKEAYLSLQKASVNKSVLFQLYDSVIPYGKLIPPSARVVLVGETHEQRRVMQEVLSMLVDYQKAHPQKKVYYASEFVDDLSAEENGFYAISREEINKAVRKRPFYRPYTEWIIRFGIPVVGLENPVVSDQAIAEDYTHNEGSDAYRVWSSPAGVDKRNNYWARVIKNILQKDPNAVVFVHAGLGHTNYNQPGSLALKLRAYQPFVLEFNYALGANLNGLIEKYAPFPKNINQYRAQLRARDEFSFYNLLAVRVMQDKRWALAVGCDMHVFFHDWAYSAK